MRLIFFIFLILSLLIHLILLESFKIKKPEKRESEPVAIEIIPKKKQALPPEEKPTEPDKSIEDISELDEKLETNLDEGRATRKDAVKKPKRQKDVKKGKKPVRKSKKDSLPELDEFRSDVHVPKISKREQADLDKIDGILNPDDVIKEYAEGGAELTGEDSVSMQYIKLKYQSYFHKFARRLYQVWIYPEKAALRGEQGIVQISFNISKDGLISSISVLSSSGYPDLDREAVLALKKMSGVPLPKSYNLEFLRVDAYFQYVMGGGFRVY